MASGQPVLTGGPPMMDVKHIFFKAHPSINYFSDEAEADAIENDVAFQHFNRSLECSNKFGCVLFSFNGSFYMLRVNDILAAQRKANADNSGPLLIKNVLSLEIRNDFLPVIPNIITLSSDDEYLAVDTLRGDSPWVVVFNLAEFINQGGMCRPFCEIRCSSSSTARISAICWNPGENMNNVVAINVDDGSLFLAKIKGASSVELSRFPDGGIRCLCWSPKGKQLVVGRTNGGLSQLKLDLTEAKPIPGPEPGSIPISILWTQTTQFLVVFQKESFIDFMQLDLSKTAPPLYRNSGDIFVSDDVPAKSSCFFLPLMQWNAVLAMTNSASDVVVLIKETQNQTEQWTPGDIADNRRAAFLLDNYARGTAVYYGSDDQVVFSETESYSQMPMLFLLSQRGSISIYSVVNADPQSPSLNVKVTTTIPDSVFSGSMGQKPVVKQEIKFEPKPAPVLPHSQPTASSLPSQQPLFQASFLPQPPPAVTPQVQPVNITPSQPGAAFGLQPKPESLFSQKPVSQPLPQPQQTQKHTGFPQQSGPRQLATSTLPSPQDMAVLQKAVEEKRREMTSQLFKGSLKGLEDDDQCAFVISEVKKFEERLASFINTLASNKHRLNELLNSSFSTLEKNVLTHLNVVEDFVSDMVSTTSAQKEEVEVLKERILNHFSQLEYAKSIVERSRDPRYLEHLRSRPLDPASQQKFQEIRKLHNYVTNQVAECRRYFYEQSRKKETAFDRISLTQLIYLTLSNHSQIIRRLTTELEKIKLQLGLGKHITAFDEAEFLAVCDAGYGNGTRSTSNPSGINEDEITLTDLTAGISRVKLNRDSDRADRKPIRFANKKLLMLKKCMPEVAVVKIKAEEVPWNRSPSKPRRPKSTSYPTTFESSFTKGMESPFRSEFENLQTFTPIGAAGPNMPYSADQVGGISGAGYDISSMMNVPVQSSMSSMSRPGLSAGSPSTVATHTVIGETHFSTRTPPKSSTFVSGISTMPLVQPNIADMSVAKSSVVAVTNSSVASPSIQHPTLAGLLSTPVSSTPTSGMMASLTSKATPVAGVVSGFANVGGISFASSTTIASGGIFGTGTSPFGTPPNVSSAKSTTAKTNTVTPVKFSAPPINLSSTGSTAPPGSTVVAPFNFNFSTSFKPPTSSASISTTFEGMGASPNIFGSILPTSTKGHVVSPPPLVPLGSTTISASSTKTSTTASTLFAAPILSSPKGTGTSSPSLELSGQLGSQPVSENTQSIFGSTAVVLPTDTIDTPASPLPDQSSPLTAPTLTPPSPLASTTSVPSNIATNLTVTPIAAAAVVASSPTTSVAVEPVSSTVSFTGPTTTSSGIFGVSLFGAPSVSSGLFGSPGGSSATSTQLAGLFSTAAAVTSTTSGGFSPATTVSSSTPSGLFSTVPVSSSPAGLFTSTPAITTSTGPFSSNPPVTTSTGLFTNPPPVTTATGLFASAPPVTTSTGLFASTQLVSTTPAGLFSVSTTTPPTGFFSPTTSVSSTAPGQASGFLSSLSISDSSNKSLAPTSTTVGGLFSAPAFGSSTTTASSIFGGSTATFGAQTSSGISGGTFSLTPSSQNQSGFGYNQSKPISTVFGTPASPPPTGAAVFGGSATFGAASPFGSTFGGTPTTSTFGPSSGVFGSTPTTAQSGSFGANAQTGTSAFGGSPFGSGQQQTSIFGSPAQSKPAASGGLFSSSFGSPAPTSAGGVFGGGSGGSLFGGTSANSGAFSAGANSGGVAQQGFGFAQAKPSTGSAFGTPPTAAPVFGGGATFGSTSPFGSSFGAAPQSPGSTFGPTSGSVFGGAAAAPPNAGFGTLAQQGTASPGFGGVGGVGGSFGSPQQQPSVFGSTPQQPKPTFGGQAFSSWR